MNPENIYKILLSNNILLFFIISIADFKSMYFNNLNNGRPFMIASHSQGSFIIQFAFEEYFPKHPEYLKRMVAAYTVGIPITKNG